MINYINYVIEGVFSLALFINALLFIPQILKIVKDKSAQHVSLLTFLGLFLIQLTIVLHGFVKQDLLLVVGYIISMITCGTVVVLIFRYSKKSPYTEKGFDIIEICDLLPCNIYVKDAAGRFIYTNKRNTETCSTSPLYALIGKTDYDVFNKSEADKIRLIDEEVVRTGKGRVVEELVTLKGENRLYLSHKIPHYNENNETIGILGVSFDITDIKEKELDRLDMLENIIAVMPWNVYWMDKGLTYRGCNNNQAKVIGFSNRKEIVGKTNTEIGGFLIPEVLDEINTKVIHEGKTITAEEPAILPNGSKGIFLSTKVPIFNRKKEIMGLVGISVDITDRKKMEASLKQAKEKSEEFNQLKSQFIENMQHDLRSPASGVTQALAYLREVEKDPEKLDVVKVGLGSSEALMSLLNEIVESSKKDYSNPVLDEPIKIEPILESVYRLNAASAKMKHLKFHYRIDKKIPKVVISDKYRLERILLNLVGNAVKFTEKGEVFFEAKCAKQDGRNLLIEFTVKDTGIGIPDDKKGIIFERFVRLEASNKGRYKGIGLGLTNVREYVRDLEGEFRPIDSAAGSGTTFSYLIPMKASLDQDMKLPSTEKPTLKAPVESVKPEPESTEVPTPVTKTPSPEKTTCGNLLLVEDSLPAQFMTKSLIKAIGCDIDIAGTAEEALEMIKQKPYDFIFADIGLPGMDGIEMVRHIRYDERKKGGKRIPIVGQSANASTANRKACIEAGMQDLLAKPLTIKAVKEVLRNYSEPYALSQPEQSFILAQIKNKQVIDQDALMRIWSDTEELKDALDQTRESTLKDINDFKEAYAKQDWKELLFFTHKLRGGFVYLAASRVEEACNYLEEYLKANKAPDEKTVKHMYDLVLTELDKALEVVNKL